MQWIINSYRVFLKFVQTPSSWADTEGNDIPFGVSTVSLLYSVLSKIIVMSSIWLSVLETCIHTCVIVRVCTHVCTHACVCVHVWGGL